MKVLFAITVLLMLHPVSRAQNEIEGEAEAAAEIMALSDENGAESIMENLTELREKPVLLNTGDEDEIGRLFFLTDFQVMVLADHVNRNGPIVSVYEIALLSGFDRSTAMLISPYISLAAINTDIGGRRGSGAVSATASVRLSSGDSDPAGVRSALRFRHNGARISYGFTAENDPGEPFGFREAEGADFVSGNIMYEGKGVLTRVIAGDYTLRFGEGLVFNSNSWNSSGLTSTSFMSGRTVLSPYVSTEENNFFRGIGFAIGKMTSGVIAFLSSNSIDARLTYDLNDSSLYISNLVSGGLHDTEAGRSARNSLSENVAGFHYSAGKDIFRGGITASYTHFSLPFSTGEAAGATVFGFHGDDLFNVGIDFKAGTGRLLFYSEAACSFPGSPAITGGFRATASGRVTVNISGRYFAPDYFTFHANTYRSGASASNEQGISGNVHIEAARHLFITAGADTYRIPWLRYRSSAPSTGRSLQFRSEYVPGEAISLRFSYLFNDREYDITDSNRGVASSRHEQREQMTVMFVYSPSTVVRTTTRAGYCRINNGADRGYMLCQDFSLTFRNSPVKMWFRYALFSTDSYASRLYAWENDMLYSFSVPALSGEGSRAAVMISWKPFEKMELRAKYAVSAKQEGEGRETGREVRVQARLVF